MNDEYRNKYADFGWANGWKDTPRLVKWCIMYGHDQVEAQVRPFVYEVRCPICKYFYKYDSSG